MTNPGDIPDPIPDYILVVVFVVAVLAVVWILRHLSTYDTARIERKGADTDDENDDDLGPFE